MSEHKWHWQITIEKQAARIEALEAALREIADAADCYEDQTERLNTRIEALEAVPDLREECANLQYMNGVYEEHIEVLEAALRRIAEFPYVGVKAEHELAQIARAALPLGQDR